MPIAIQRKETRAQLSARITGTVVGVPLKSKGAVILKIEEIYGVTPVPVAGNGVKNSGAAEGNPVGLPFYDGIVMSDGFVKSPDAAPVLHPSSLRPASVLEDFRTLSANFS